MGEALAVNARLYPDKPGASDRSRSMTFRQWDERARRLANALVGLGLEKGDRGAILARNAVEGMEIYAAAAIAGLMMVPINFRLVGAEIRYIVEEAPRLSLRSTTSWAPWKTSAAIFRSPRAATSTSAAVRRSPIFSATPARL